MAYSRENPRITNKIFVGNFLHRHVKTLQTGENAIASHIPTVQMLTIVTHFPYLDRVYF